jgi:8-oxo-dGTP diphosphatase
MTTDSNHFPAYRVSLLFLNIKKHVFMDARLEFGQATSTNVIIRPGSYAVLFNEKGEAGIVKTDEGYYFLAGGGIEDGETPEETLHREVKEEAGLFMDITSSIGTVAEHYHDKENDRHYKKVVHLYLVEPKVFVPEAQTEPDHTFMWLPIPQAYRLMYHDAYRWGIDKGYKLWKSAK